MSAVQEALLPPQAASNTTAAFLELAAAQLPPGQSASTAHCRLSLVPPLHQPAPLSPKTVTDPGATSPSIPAPDDTLLTTVPAGKPSKVMHEFAGHI
jgi:hypothetical protein